MSPLARLALSTRLAPRAIVPLASAFARPSVTHTASRHFHPTIMASKPIATLDVRVQDQYKD